MSHPIIDPDLTFRQGETAIILKDYVCAVCNLELAVIEIPNNERVFIVCPDHGNVCLCGRVMRSTASMKIERTVRDYYPLIAAFPDLFGSIWQNGIPRDRAEKIKHDYVCALCGIRLESFLILDQFGKTVQDSVTLKCHHGHGNVGLNGIGMVRQSEYVHIPPVKWREFLRKRGAAPTVTPVDRLKNTESFEKLGVITYGNRDDGAVNDSFKFVIFGGKPKLLESIRAEFGNDPKSIRVRIPSPILQSTLDCFAKGALIARAIKDGDNYRWDYFRDPETQEIEIRGGTARTLIGLRMQGVTIDPTKPIYHNAKGKPFPLQRVTRLRMVIPLKDPVLGYFETSFKDDDATIIEEGVKAIHNQCFENGKMVSEVPLTLSLYKDDSGDQKLKIETE